MKPRKFALVLLAVGALAVAAAVLGLLQLGAGEVSMSAEEGLRQALLKNPGDAAARMELASLLTGKKAWMEAAVTLQDGVRLAPDDVNLARALSKVYAGWAAASGDEKKLERAREAMRVVFDSGQATVDEYVALAEEGEDSGDYKRAVWAYERAFKLAPEREDLRRRSYYARLFAGKYEEAREFYQGVVERDPADAAALHNLALAHLYLGDYSAAEATLSKRLQLPEERGRDSSEKKLDEARRLQSAEKGAGTFKAHFELGQKHKRRDRFDRALAELETAVGLSTRTSADLAEAYNSLGYLSSMMNDWERAEKYAEVRVKVCREAGDLWQLSHACQGLALVYRRKAKTEPARRTELLEKALAAHQEQLESTRAYDEYFMEVRSLADLASCARELYGLDDARTKQYRAELAPHLPKDDEPLHFAALVSAASIEASLRMEEKDYEGAEKLLLLCTGQKMDGHRRNDASVFDKLASVAFETGQYDKAIEYARKGIGFMTSYRMDMGSDAARQRVGGTLWNSLFATLVRCGLAKGDAAMVFDYSEQYKARALLELLHTKANTERGRERLMLAQAEQEAASATEGAEGGMVGAPSATRDLLVEQARYGRLPEDARVAGRQVPSYRGSQTLTTAEAQAMAKEFTFISYGVTQSSAMAVVLSSGSVNVMELPDAGERDVRETVERFRDAMGLKQAPHRDLAVEPTCEASANAAARDAALRESLQRLYDLLIAPVRPFIKTSVVYISADGILNYLPFEAFMHEGRYLVEDYAIAYAPSATVLKQCMDKERHGRASVLALGNPNLQNPAFRLINAEEEVRMLSDLFETADVLTGDAANERAVQERAGKYDVLHFACHGELNLDDPMLTSLRLSPDDANDGYLHAGEVFDLDLAASLVVLSACNTGLGELHAGNELMGLTRSFLYAGAPSIVASLWTVDDRSTAFLMREFYKNLSGMNKAEALRQAKLATMREYPNPFHWAAFCLQGDYRN